MEMKDLLRIEKLSKKDKVMSVMLIIGVIVLVLIIFGNARSGDQKPPSGTVKKGEYKKYDPGIPSIEKKSEKLNMPSMSSQEMEKIKNEVGRDNPFLPPGRKANRQGKYSSGFRLEGVTMDSDGKLMAIINDEIIGMGGMISGGEVISIEKDEVRIKKGDEEHILKLWSDQDLR